MKETGREQAWVPAVGVRLSDRRTERRMGMAAWFQIGMSQKLLKKGEKSAFGILHLGSVALLPVSQSRSKPAMATNRKR